MREIIHKKSFLKKITRSFFEDRDYVEVSTPIVVSSPGAEAYLDYFQTTYQSFAGDHAKYYLRSSPEIHLKKIVSQGIERVFELGPCFRNGGELGPWHHPEFQMLEWYRGEADLGMMIEETVNYLQVTNTLWSEKYGATVPTVIGSPHVISVFETFKQICGIYLVDNDSELADKARSAGCDSVNAGDDFATAFDKIMLTKIEPKLKELGFVVLRDFPASQATLSTVTEGWADRFEVYVDGVELCNAYQELCGAEENEQRFHQINSVRDKEGKEILPIDTEFIDAMGKVKSQVVGNALGFDRWFALLTGQSSIDDGILFRKTYE